MTIQELDFSVYDCFTEKRFGGNLGAIVWKAETLNDNQMQKIANEFNLPVTGYVLSNKKNTISARFFMPNAEIAMCGHVTIGIFTEIIKNQSGNLNNYKLLVPAGEININIENNINLPLVKFSLNLPKIIQIDPDLSSIVNALKINSSDVSSSSPIGAADAGLKHLFINLKNEELVQSLSPDFEHLLKLSKELKVQTIACFSFRNIDSPNVLKIRDFCPALGVNEVPASGTTNGALAGYLLMNNLIESKSQRIISYQGNEVGRPSKIISDIDVNNGNITKLFIGGTAVSSFSGKVKIS